ncbi:PREDICTED: protein trichome birefringence-like 12 [Erythranthe guttata]|uniref:protein trichome birefringence-like 12 n=1 Tax=Erythranthe guttata TaxID=4155 RepID=UPI00064E1450|nr:PREDICTED: protein trichome birefringence-like 12 [Erythranthe guttata]|eukprot:XP_012828265.1 PREDICTED: protein trichome birefringence-like 12 [Erythranthe guttata]
MEVWQTKQTEFSVRDGVKGIYRVDVDIPSPDWAHIADFYNVLVFNTGHWWGYDKFPKESPLVFFKNGEPIHPSPNMFEGFKIVVENMVSHIEKSFPKNVLKLWRLQSPRHFHGGDWNQNGTCLFDDPLEQFQLDLWFDPSNNGVNKEARKLNRVIEESLKGTSIRKLDLSHLSEFRADAHPAIWLGKKDAVVVWGQDCMHWCLPGVPDTWVDILAQFISYTFRN